MLFYAGAILKVLTVTASLLREGINIKDWLGISEAANGALPFRLLCFDKASTSCQRAVQRKDQGLCAKSSLKPLELSVRVH